MANRNPSSVGYQSRSSTASETSGPEAVPGTGGNVPSTADRVRVEVQEKAGQAVEQAGERTKSMLDGQKERAASGLGDVARMLQRTAEQMDQEDQASVARYAYRAADTVDRLSSTMRDRSVDEILDDVEAYARRQPEVVIGGALILGFLASRFLKSSSARRQQPMGGSGYAYQSPSRSSSYLAGGWPQGGSRWEHDSSPESYRSRSGMSSGTGWSAESSTYTTPSAMATSAGASTAAPSTTGSAGQDRRAQTPSGGTCAGESE